MLSELLAQTFVNGINVGALYGLAAVGLSLTFGVMKILNVAHGAFYAWGAYAAAYTIGLASDNDWPDWSGFVLIGEAD